MKVTWKFMRGTLAVVWLILLLLALGACSNMLNEFEQTSDGSTNADLSGITLTDGTLEPSFDPSVTSYNVVVGYNVTGIIVSGTADDTSAEVGGDFGTLQDLSLGDNPITLSVTAEDETTTKEYKVNCKRKMLVLKDIPAGSFQRDGVADNVSSIEEPFRMSRYEITRQQFLDIMGTDPSIAHLGSSMNDPVHDVNWYHAIAFCNKLSLGG